MQQTIIKRSFVNNFNREAQSFWENLNDVPSRDLPVYVTSFTKRMMRLQGLSDEEKRMIESALNPAEGSQWAELDGTATLSGGCTKGPLPQSHNRLFRHRYIF